MKANKIEPQVKSKIMTYPLAYRKKIILLRELISQASLKNPEIETMIETLKWGEPSYLPERKNIGTTIRIAWLKSKPNQYGMYFNCQTDLIKKFKLLFGRTLTFEGNRAIIFNLEDKVPKSILKTCINMALTYHLDKKSK